MIKEYCKLLEEIFNGNSTFSDIQINIDYKIFIAKQITIFFYSFVQPP